MFVALACHLTSTRWVWSTIKPLCTVHSLSSALLINLGNIENSGKPRLKPGAVGWELQMLPLCYAAPPPLSNLHCLKILCNIITRWRIQRSDGRKRRRRFVRTGRRFRATPIRRFVLRRDVQPERPDSAARHRCQILPPKFDHAGRRRNPELPTSLQEEHESDSGSGPWINL